MARGCNQARGGPAASPNFALLMLNTFGLALVRSTCVNCVSPVLLVLNLKELEIGNHLKKQKNDKGCVWLVSCLLAATLLIDHKLDIHKCE
eukprot:364443-Chlamydomonas_euryale.AAC.30